MGWDCSAEPVGWAAWYEFPPGSDLHLLPTVRQDCYSGVCQAHRKKSRIDLIAEYDVESQAQKEAILLCLKFMRN